MADYFSHDYNSRNDPKLINLQMELGHEGKGIFWDIIEILYEQGGYIHVTAIKSIAFVLQTQYDRITRILTEFDLFETDGQVYWSESVLRRLELRGEKSNKARENVQKRWEKYDRNTTVIRDDEGRNTIKESKVKEIKEKESKVNKTDGEDFDQNFIVPEIIFIYSEIFPDFIRDQKRDGRSAKTIFDIISRNARVEDVDRSQVMDIWRNICEGIRDKPAAQFYAGAGLSTIANSLPTIIQKIRDGKNGNRKTAATRPIVAAAEEVLRRASGENPD